MSPRKSQDQDRTRFTLWLTQETLDELGKTQRRLEKGSVAEVVRDAIDIEPIRSWLQRFPDLLIRDADAHTVHAEIGQVKVSFIANYRYAFLQRPHTSGLLAIADIIDIALMKMLAITHRATVRDYIDLAAIVRDHCSLATVVEKSTQKYGNTFNVALCLRTMVHFGDLDKEAPVLLDSTLAHAWKDILVHAVADVARQYGISLDY